MDIEALTKQMVESVKGYVSRAINIVTARLDALDSRADEVEKRIAAIPAGEKGDRGEKGENGTPAEVDYDRIGLAIKEVVEVAVAEIPKPKDGIDGKDGAPGKDADALEIYNNLREELNAVIAAIPISKDGAPGKDGVDGKNGVDGINGKDGVDGINGKDGAPGKDGIDGKDGADGKDVHVDTIALMIAERIEKAVAALPPPIDGINGRDAAEMVVLPSIDEAKSYPAGTWAKYCGGLIKAERTTDPIIDSITSAGWSVMIEGISAVVISQGDDERTLAVAAMLTSGTKAISEFSIPMMIYREVWREGEYEKGDVVTWSGSAWHCQEKTIDKPGTSSAWKLMVKSGAPGKDATKQSGTFNMPREPVRLK